MTKKDRVRLLATSYLDARFAERTSQEPERGKPGSRAPVIETKLWMSGSYAEFQREMDRLRSQGPWGRQRWRAVYGFYVEGHKHLEASRVKLAEEGLSIICNRMPDDAIKVPADIKANGGFRPDE